MLSGIAFGLLALVFWSLSDIATKISLDRESKWKVLAYSQIFGFFVLLLFGLYSNNIRKITIPSASQLAFIGILNFTGFAFFYKAIKKKGISTTSAIVGGWPLIPIFLGITLLGERLSLLQTMSVAVIVIGIHLIIHKKKFQLDTGYVYAIISMLFFGVNMFLIKIPIEIMGAVVVSAGIKLTTGLLSLPKAIMDKVVLSSKKLGPIFLIGVLESLGFLAYALGIEQTGVSLVATVSSAYPALTAVLGYTLLKEKLSSKQMIGIGVTVLGLVLISV